MGDSRRVETVENQRFSTPFDPNNPFSPLSNPDLHDPGPLTSPDPLSTYIDAQIEAEMDTTPIPESPSKRASFSNNSFGSFAPISQFGNSARPAGPFHRPTDHLTPTPQPTAPRKRTRTTDPTIFYEIEDNTPIRTT